MRRAAVALVSLATAGAACSAFSAADSPPRATPDGDAAAPPVSDADAAAVDAGVDADDCPLVFSETFANAALPPAGWMLTPSSNNGSLSVTAMLPDGAAPLGGNALVATAQLTDEVVTAENLSIRRRDPVAKPFSVAVLAFDVLVTRAEYATYANFGCQLRLETNGGAATERIVPRTKSHSDFAFDVDATGYADGGSSDAVVVRALPIGTWTHVGSTFLIDGSGSSRGELSVSAQGDSDASSASVTFPAPPGAIDAIMVECGIPFADTGPGTFEVAIDNVALRTCPR